MIKNAIEKSHSVVGINYRYDLSIQNALDLIEEYKNAPTDLVCASFRLGYLQGMKAERAKAKRGETK